MEVATGVVMPVDTAGVMAVATAMARVSFGDKASLGVQSEPVGRERVFRPSSLSQLASVEH